MKTQMIVILNLFQDNRRGSRVILKQVQDDEGVGLWEEVQYSNITPIVLSSC